LGYIEYRKRKPRRKGMIGARIIAEALHGQMVRDYEWSEEVNPWFLRNRLTRSYKEIYSWMKDLGLRQVNLPQEGEDIVPQEFPEWLRNHIEEYRKIERDVPRVYPDAVNYIPSIEEVEQVINGWGADWLWEWVPEIELSWEELESCHEPWMSLSFWKDALSENVNRIARREAIKPHKNF
jgi:hypothetical protein